MSYCRLHRHLPSSIHKLSLRREQYYLSWLRSYMSTKCDITTTTAMNKDTTTAPSPSTSTSLQLLPSTIFPMHILGGGSIGLLFASSIHHDAHKSYNDRIRRHTSSNGEINDDPTNNNHPVTLLMRSHHRPHLVRRSSQSQWFAPVTLCGTSTTDNDDTANVRKINCDLPVELIETNITEDDDSNSVVKPPIKCLLLCTKATDAIPALETVWDRLLPSSPLTSSSSSSSSPAKVIILSNGALAIRDAIYQRFGGRNETTQTLDEIVQIECATTTHGAYKTPSSSSSSPSQSITNNNNNRNENEPTARHYSITHAGIGSTHSTNKEFSRLCQSIGWDSSYLSKSDMNVMLWRKLAVNCVINPLTALYGVKNGQLRELKVKHGGQDIGVVTRRILEEVSSVALMEMESLMDEEEDGVDNDIELLQSTREKLSVPLLEAFVFRVMADTADNISSMLQDAKAGRTTEVRYLNGYVAHLGQDKYGVECPWNTEMCQLVEDLPS